ncbi:methyltransferase family protein [Micromonospora sp. Llam0]|uniref:class I SAM-dependent methyltransferase n=1 Tax=Micromonospora sp. Llam0 TaxID=2485143 RepID=UPI000FBD807C|nr:methyltransferase domain-containing protein [Micromonospora sp. Llam0]ROO63048.1 methyltransferase family protein [Micromonospora sp. Llam0]
MSRDRDSGRDSTDRAALAGLLAEIRDRVLDAARLRPGHHVLDLGAGTGLLTHTAARTVAPTGQVIALDMSATALTHLDTNAFRIHPVAGDASRLPIATATIDRVVTRSVLIYLPDLPAALGEIARVLRPAGMLSVFEPINARRHHDAHLDGLTAAEIEAIDELRSRSSPTAGPMMAFDVAPMTTAVLRAGFTAPTLHQTTVTDRLTSHAQVDAYLRRRPHPGADSPIDQVTHHLGADTAARYNTAWHHALDQATDPGGITFTTPVLYLTSRLPHH